MTGYGRGDASDGQRTVTTEIRAVNHRYCEITVKMPSKYAFAEEAVKSAVRARAQRGKIDVTILVQSTAEEDVAVVLNAAAAKQYYRSMRELARQFDIEEDVPLELLAQMPEVLRQGRADIDEDAVRTLLLSATDAALSAFDAMRAAEGAALADDLSARLDDLADVAAAVEARAPEVQAAYAAKLPARIEQLLEKPVDRDLLDQRLAIEIASFADKASIEEELVRFASHIAQFRGILALGGAEPVGKRLDFLVQEMNREANTIGSKANDLLITDYVIRLKTGVENVREQVQNIC
jgi:uncharacterized protein (TIGR00255 family)